MNYNTCKVYSFVDKLEDMQESLENELFGGDSQANSILLNEDLWLKLARVQCKLNQLKGVYRQNNE